MASFLQKSSIIRKIVQYNRKLKEEFINKGIKNKIQIEIIKAYEHNKEMHCRLEEFCELLRTTNNVLGNHSCYSFNQSLSLIKFKQQIPSNNSYIVDPTMLWQYFKDEYAIERSLNNKNNPIPLSIKSHPPKESSLALPEQINRHSYICLVTIQVKNSGVKSLRQLNDGRLISLGCFGSQTISVWNLSTFKEIDKINISTQITTFLGLPNIFNDFFHINIQETKVEQWNNDLLQCMQALTSSSTQVFSLIKLDKNRIATSHANKTIKIWHWPGLKRFTTITHQFNNIKVLLMLKDGRLVSGGWKKMICFWDLSLYQCNTCLLGHTDSIEVLVQLQDETLVSAGWDKMIKFWDVTTFKCIKSIEAHSSGIATVIQLRDGRLVSGGHDKKIKIWDVQSYNCLRILEGHKSVVTSVLQLNNGRLASGGDEYDRKIKIWDI